MTPHIEIIIVDALVEIPNTFEVIFQLHVMHVTAWFHVQSHVDHSNRP